MEPRANRANWFVFNKTGGRYYFEKKQGFETLVKTTEAKLGRHKQSVEQLIDLFVPMKTQQAEIVATLFAAWNNLLLNNLPASDEDIVYEARENWHEEKLEIEREKFFRAIEWMREKNLVPQGKGRLVKKRGKA